MPTQDESGTPTTSTGGAPDEAVPTADEELADEPAVDASPIAVSDAVTLGVAGETVSVKDSVVGAMAAGSVEATDTFVLLGTVGSLEGDSRVLIDTRAAVLMGLAFGLVVAIGRWLLGGSGDDAVDLALADALDSGDAATDGTVSGLGEAADAG